MLNCMPVYIYMQLKFIGQTTCMHNDYSVCQLITDITMDM